MDGIDSAQMQDVTISNLENRSPLASCACGNYSGPHDGGNPGSKEREGSMNTDTTGISIIDGDLSVMEANSVHGLTSWYGDAVGVHLMEDAILDFDDDGSIDIYGLFAASKTTQDVYDNAIEIGKSPYPNNFERCNVSKAESATIINNDEFKDDCTLTDFPQKQLPEECNDKCDAFSVSLTNKYHDGDNVCLTYDIERKWGHGACKKSVKYIVLGVCDNDKPIKRARDLTGLIESIEPQGIYAWGTKINDRLMGIRVDIPVNVYESFTICLHDVFNIDDEYSSRVAIKRGKYRYLCDEDWVVGLPCVDEDKFQNGQYGNSGFNRWYNYRGRHRKWWMKQSQDQILMRVY